MITDEEYQNVFEYIGVTCLAYCPICEQEFDADHDEDIEIVIQHIREEHIEEEIKEFLSENK